MSINIKSTKVKDIHPGYDALDNLRTAIIIFDKDFKYIYTNTAAIDLLGSSTTLKDITRLQCEKLSWLNWEGPPPALARPAQGRFFDTKKNAYTSGPNKKCKFA